MNGDDIRMIRGVMGDTIAEFSARIGVSRSHLQAVETGGKEISLPMHVKVLRVLDSPDYQAAIRRINDLPAETRKILRGYDIWD
jgi:DNA-binding transcriptional regulator YiaG